MWDEAVVLDKRLDSEMGSRDKWRVCSNKRSAVSGSSCIQSPCEVTDCKCADKRQKQEMLSACEVTAEPVCEVTAEQAHEVKDAEPTQLAEPALSQFSPPTPVSPFPPGPPHPSVSPSFAISPSPHSPVQSVSPMVGFLFC